MKRRLTATERDDTNRVVAMVMNQVAACATGDEARDMAMNFVHGGAAALVGTNNHDFTADFLKKLADIIARQGEDARRAGMN